MVKMPTLSEAYKDTPVNQNLIIPLDFSLIKGVPESHAWAQCYDNSKTNPNNNEKSRSLNSIPVIDLNDSNTLDLIYNACETWGMFQVTNHGISKELLDQLESQSKNLFNLPFEEKMKVVRSPDGATGYGYPRITPFFSKLMWSEGFTIMGDSVHHDAKKLWPKDFQGFCEVMSEYQTRLKDLGDKLKSMLFKSLSIPEPTLLEESSDQDFSTALQLNSYPECPDPTQTMGLAPHTDSLFLTILHQSGNTSGLQVLKEGLGWVSVDPYPGALVVNVGDLLHIISNARFPSAIHRAVVNNEKQRLSVKYRFGPHLQLRESVYFTRPKEVPSQNHMAIGGVAP